MKQFFKVLGISKAQAFHAFVAVFFMLAAVTTKDGLCLFVSVAGFFYGLYNYCKSINFSSIEE